MLFGPQIANANLHVGRPFIAYAYNCIYNKIFNHAALVHGLQAVFFFSFRVERLNFPLGHIVSWTSNHGTYDAYLPKVTVVETVIHGQCYGYCFLYCV